MENNYEEKKLDSLLQSPAPDLSHEEILNTIDQQYGLQGTLYPLDSERDQNLRIETADGQSFVIKIANSAERIEIIDMQIKALEHIALVDPQLPVPRVLNSVNGLPLEKIQSKESFWLS